MIIVKISGGLGNQLFQYAFGQYLANKLSTDVLYDIQTNLRINNFTPRTLALLNFNLKLNKATEKDIRKMRYFSKNGLQRMERKLVQLYPFLNTKYKVEKNSHSEFIQDVKDNCYYDGYWQSYKYLTDNKILKITKITIEENVRSRKKDIISRIQKSESISIHIRRGDYLTVKNNTNIFATCNLDYYFNAINYINQYVDNPVFYIFSDDINWAKENFNGIEYIFMENNEPYEDMYLMSLCKHQITANSTFSWWGAWLNNNNEKIVITPKQWYVGELNKTVNELIPEEWIKI